MAPRLQLADKFCLIGTCASIVFYACNLYLLVQFIATRPQGGDSPRTRKSKLWTHVTTWLAFTSTSVYLFLEIYAAFIGFTQHRDFPDGFVAWMDNAKFKGIWVIDWVSGLGSAWILETLMLYQCFLIYYPQGKVLWIMSFPTIFLLSSIGTGVYLILFSSFLKLKVLQHFPFCVSARLSMSSLMIAKLLQQRKKLRADFGNDSAELASPYTFLIHVLVQSYASYSFISFAFLGLFIGHESAWRLLLPCLAQTGLMAHLLIQVRVARNRNESPRSEKPIPPIEFTRSSIEDSNRSTTSSV